jgi:hypothetical protein
MEKIQRRGGGAWAGREQARAPSADKHDLTMPVGHRIGEKGKKLVIVIGGKKYCRWKGSNGHENECR